MYIYREMYMERIIPHLVKSLLHFYFKIETKLELHVTPSCGGNGWWQG